MEVDGCVWYMWWISTLYPDIVVGIAFHDFYVSLFSLFVRGNIKQGSFVRKKTEFASFGQGQFKPSCWKQVLGTYLPQTAQNLFLCTNLSKKQTDPNLFLNTYFVQNLFWGTCPKPILRHIFVPKCPKSVLGHLFVQNCPKPILRHPFVPKLFYTYLSKTAQNLFKHFDGYVDMASDLVSWYRMLHGRNELDN